jgi:hypothetical protein
MRLLPVYHLGVCALILAFAFITGCNGTERTMQNTNFSLETVTIVTSGGPTTLICPVPSLIFNNSQSFTTLHTGLIITGPGDNISPDNYPIPNGSIIYHLPDSVTRIFDPSGKQILIINDSESTVKAGPHGIKEATYHVAMPGRNTGYNGNGIFYYVNESDPYHPSCIAIIIYAPGTNAPAFPMIPIYR